MPKCRRAGTLDVLQDLLALPHGRIVHRHPGVVDRRVNDAVGVRLGGPDVIVDRASEGFARRVEFEDRDDLAGLRLLDEVVVVEPPGRRDIGAEAAASMAGMAARTRPHVEDAHFQDIAGLGILDRHRAGQQVDPDPFARAFKERSLGRPGASALDGLMLPRPGKDAFGPGIARDHAVPIVAGVMRQRLDRGAVAGLHGQGR